MKRPVLGRATTREICPAIVPFEARRALNECENVLTSLYWCVQLLEDGDIGDATDLWHNARRYAARLENRLQGGELERLDIATRSTEAIENLYRTFCLVRGAFKLSDCDFPRVFQSRKRKLPMTCLEMVKSRRTLGLIGGSCGLVRLVAENNTFTDDPRAADLGYPLILPDLFPTEDFEDGIFLCEWNLSGKKCEYEPTTAEELLTTGRFQLGLVGHGWPVKWTYAVCQSCGHVIGTDLVDGEQLETVYRKCDEGTRGIRELRQAFPEAIGQWVYRKGDEGTQEADFSPTIPFTRPVWSRPYAPADLAKLFGWGWKTVKKRIDAGQVRAKRLSSKSYRIHVEDLPDNT